MSHPDNVSLMIDQAFFYVFDPLTGRKHYLGLVAELDNMSEADDKAMWAKAMKLVHEGRKEARP